MRVISGKYRGKPLFAPEGMAVRPTIDRVKESIFNVIQFNIAQSRFVDLFTGTGSMGIEAISRGASEVIFSDIAKSSLDCTKANLKGIDGNYKILNRDYRETLNSIVGSVDFIFVDAPFALDCINEITKIVKAKNLLKENGYIIYEHDVEKKYDLSYDFFIEKRKTFGKVVVDYIAITKSVCAVTGSFDPITVGHLDVIEQAAENYDRVLVLVAQNEDKKAFFTLKQRADVVKAAVQDLSNVSVDYTDGFVFEYLNNKKIGIIVRGYRTEQDYLYEQDMAKYNKEHGNVETVLYKATNKYEDVSSTKVRTALENGENIRTFVPKYANNLIVKIFKENLKK